jgi:hypothetical protein
LVRGGPNSTDQRKETTMNDNNPRRRLRIPKLRLCRDAERAVQIWRRHAGESPMLDARGAVLAPVAERYLASNDAHAKLEQQVSTLRRERDAAAVTLRDNVLQWLPSLHRDLPAFDSSGLTDSAVPVDVVACSRLLRQRLDAYARAGAAPPYAGALDGALLAEEQRVLSATRSADEAAAAAEQARSERHAAALELDTELIAFRATLRRVLGSTNVDYRQLRARSSREEHELDAPPATDEGGELAQGIP